jgi:hypothetical protein
LDIANAVTIVALIVASFLIAYLTAQHALKQAAENAREQLELRLSGFTHAVAELELRVEQLTRATDALAAAGTRLRTQAANVASEAKPAAAVSEAPPKPEAEIPAETLILISAAVTSYLGKKVRIRSAKMLQSPYEIVNPWAQQGRVIVQASHNLQVRHR